MNAFYNKEGVGDTLLISLQDVTREQLGYEKHGDVVKIFNNETKDGLQHFQRVFLLDH